jgi:hypothetical protein
MAPAAPLQPPPGEGRGCSFLLAGWTSGDIPALRAYSLKAQATRTTPNGQSGNRNPGPGGTRGAWCGVASLRAVTQRHCHHAPATTKLINTTIIRPPSQPISSAERSNIRHPRSAPGGNRFDLRRRKPTSPTRAEPSSSIELGSGTLVGGSVTAKGSATNSGEVARSSDPNASRPVFLWPLASAVVVLPGASLKL